MGLQSASQGGASPTQAAASLAAVRAAFPTGKNTRSSSQAAAEAPVSPTKFGKDGESFSFRFFGILREKETDKVT